jgi:hypothetical protein
MCLQNDILHCWEEEAVKEASPQGPKKPLTVFNLFSQHARKMIREENRLDEVIYI